MGVSDLAVGLSVILLAAAIGFRAGQMWQLDRMLDWMDHMAGYLRSGGTRFLGEDGPAELVAAMSREIEREGI